jgi:hypothetical protein
MRNLPAETITVVEPVSRDNNNDKPARKDKYNTWNLPVQTITMGNLSAATITVVELVSRDGQSLGICQ